MNNNILIAPSLLAADFAELNKAVRLVHESTAEWLHLDVMDGLFVPNISFGPLIVETAHRLTSKPLDVHLMIVQPERYLRTFRDVGAAYITVHYEACTHLHRTIAEIKELGCKAGVALNPHTPVLLLKDILKDLDLVCLMSVNPGFGGQKFIEHTYKKITELTALIHATESSALIEVDGGINTDNASRLKSAGANVLVAGSSVFGASNPSEAIEKLRTV